MVSLQLRFLIHKPFFMRRSSFSEVQHLELQRVFSSKAFTRLVLIIWLICAVSMVVVLKNMEFIVHIKMYEYGLLLNPDWLDPYTLYSTLIYYFCLAPPMALSGIALVSGFFRTEEVPVKTSTVPQRLKQPQAVRVRAQPIVKEMPKRVMEVPRRVENGNRISCPNCKKVFGRALVMLDFRGGQNRLVSVCPYCNYILGVAREKKRIDDNIHVLSPDEQIVR